MDPHPELYGTLVLLELILVNCSHFQWQLVVTRVDLVGGNMLGHVGSGTLKFLATFLFRYWNVSGRFAAPTKSQTTIARLSILTDTVRGPCRPFLYRLQLKHYLQP